MIHRYQITGHFIPVHFVNGIKLKLNNLFRNSFIKYSRKIIFSRYMCVRVFDDNEREGRQPELR